MSDKTLSNATLRVLEDASQFLRQFDLGPASIIILDSATTPKSLAPFHDVLRCHALLDTDGAGMNLYRALKNEGAFSGAKDASTWDVDKECEAYLVAEYACLVAGQQRIAPMAYGTRLSDCLSDINAVDPVAGREVSAQVEALVEKAFSGNVQSVKEAFKTSSSQYTRDIVKDILYYVTALEHDAAGHDLGPAPQSRKPVPYGGLVHN
jgi:hypothetical protein